MVTNRLNVERFDGKVATSTDVSRSNYWEGRTNVRCAGLVSGRGTMSCHKNMLDTPMFSSRKIGENIGDRIILHMKGRETDLRSFHVAIGDFIWFWGYSKDATFPIANNQQVFHMTAQVPLGWSNRNKK